MQIEHVGIAVKNLEQAIKLYKNILGVDCILEEVEDQKVRTAIFKIDNVKIELLESTCADGPIAKFIDKKGEGIHHLAFKVANINSALSDMENLGVNLIDKQPRKGADNLNIAFLHPKSTNGALIELCSEQ